MDPRNSLRRFNRALAHNDEFSARAACSRAAWDARGNNMAQLYRQLGDRGRGRGYSLRLTGTPRTSESARVVAVCTVLTDDGEPVARLHVLCDHIPCLLVGWTHSPVVSDKYLSGIVPADIGMHSLHEHEPSVVAARTLADDLQRADAGDDEARARLAEMAHDHGGDAATLGYLQLRIATGCHLAIERALRLPPQPRTAIAARLAYPADAHEEDELLWLYARDGEPGQLVLTGHRPEFDLDALLG